FTPHICITLLSVMSGLHFASYLNDLLGGFMNDILTSELAITNLGLVDKSIQPRVNGYPNHYQNQSRMRVTCLTRFGGFFRFAHRSADEMQCSCLDEFTKLSRETTKT
ncbi:hypothetical protein Tco_0180365, partial [Tanacetum coccineum]